MIAIGNEELGDEVKKGDLAICPNCGCWHPLVFPKDKDGKESQIIGLVNCNNGESYLAALGGRLIK